MAEPFEGSDWNCGNGGGFSQFQRRNVEMAEGLGPFVYFEVNGGPRCSRLTWAHFRLSSDHFRLTSDQFGSVQAQQEVVGVQRLAQLAHLNREFLFW